LDFLKAGDLGLEAWRGFDFLGDEFLKVVGLFFQAGNSFFYNGEKRFIGNGFRKVIILGYFDPSAHPQ